MNTVSEELLLPSEEIKEISYWQNSDNSEYYENIPVENLKDFAIRGGFENGCDIDLIFPYISESNSIIEVGAGYGRVLNHLLRKDYKGKLYAVERSKNLFEHLSCHFKNKVNLINADAKYLALVEKVDTILWMWSNISEFPKNEQEAVLNHLSQWLNPNGLLVVETILHTLVPKNVDLVDGQSYIVYSEYGTAYGYTPSSEEIQVYANRIGFKNVNKISYKTDTGRERILHLLRR